MILVTGATGPFGQAAIEFILRKGVPANSIAAFVRNRDKAAGLHAKGINLRIGNYDDSTSLAEAMKGVDRLLFVSGSELERRMEQHENVVAAARKSGVKHIVYTSVARHGDLSSSPIAFVAQSHIQTENLIKESEIPYTFMLNGLYADMLPIFFGEKVLETGIFLPAGDGKAAFTTRRDMAEAAASVIVSRGHENMSYRTVSPNSYSMTELAAILSELTGKNVGYIKPDLATFTENMKRFGVPDGYIAMMAGFSQAIAKGELVGDGSDLEKLIGHPATPMKEFLGTVYK